jgi:hypothetical protein
VVSDRCLGEAKASGDHLRRHPVRQSSKHLLLSRRQGRLGPGGRASLAARQHQVKKQPAVAVLHDDRRELDPPAGRSCLD